VHAVCDLVVVTQIDRLSSGGDLLQAIAIRVVNILGDAVYPDEAAGVPRKRPTSTTDAPAVVVVRIGRPTACGRNRIWICRIAVCAEWARGQVAIGVVIKCAALRDLNIQFPSKDTVEISDGQAVRDRDGRLDGYRL
jgi:hypothetical protein